MDLTRTKPSKNLDDRTMEGRFGGQIRAAFDPKSFPWDLNGSDGPGDYGAYLKEMLNTMKPDDLKAMKNAGYTFEDMMFVHALKKYGIKNLTDPQFKKMYYGR